MRRVAILLASLALAGPALAAPLDDGEGLPDAAPGAASPELPQAARAPANPRLRSLPHRAATPPMPDAPGLADRDGNALADGLEARLAQAAAAERIEVLVQTEPGFGPAGARAALGAFELRRRFTLVDGFSARLTPGQIRALSRLPGVRRVERNVEVHATLETARLDAGIDEVQAGRGLPRGYRGEGVGICIVDTGIYADHVQFRDPATGASKVVAFFDAVNGRTAAYDDNFHGTHVASIAAGDGTGPDPVWDSDYRGVAPDARLYGAKVLDAGGAGTLETATLGVEWCADQPGVDIINLSLGSATASDGNDILSLAVDAAVAAGKVVVVAAGNNGAGTQTIGSPGAASLAITVGAAAEWTPHSDPIANDFGARSEGHYLTAFSGRGPTAPDIRGQTRIKPDIVGPGHSIVAAVTPDPFGRCLDDCYAILSGTSMASPFVAGTAALMLDANPGLDPATLKAQLTGTAPDRGPAGKDNDWGFGPVDGYAAVAAAAGVSNAGATAFPAYSQGIGQVSGGTATLIPLDVTDGTLPLAVTVTVLDGGPRLLCGFFDCWYEWRPDFDVALFDPLGFLVAEGRCLGGGALGDECGKIGRQETLHLTTPQPGQYTLAVYKGTSDSADGSVRYEVSTGPLTDGQPAPQNAPPTAVASSSPSGIVTDYEGDGEHVQLDGSASSDSDGTVVAYHWIWGTWQSTVVSPEITLPAGTHTIALEVTDDDGATGSDSLTIEINQPPAANAGPDQTVSDDDGDGLAAVTLDGRASQDPDGSLASFSWTEGMLSHGEGPTLTTDLATGSHTITLTVTDDDGALGSDTLRVDVVESTDPPAQNQPPLAVASFSPAVPTVVKGKHAEVTLDGSGSSDDGTIVSYLWTENNKRLATSAVDTVKLRVGTHTVILTVTDDGGLTASDFVTITVPEVGSAGGRS